MAAEAQLKADYARFLSTAPTPLSAAERTRIRQLAADLPTLWTAATTTTEERQAIVRVLIERVIVTVIGTTANTSAWRFTGPAVTAPAPESHAPWRAWSS